MECECHRVDEFLELLQPLWIKQQKLSLAQVLQVMAQEAGHDDSLETLSDDVLIFHMQIKNGNGMGRMPGVAMQYVPDFKSAILEARGFKNDNGHWFSE